MSLSAHSPRSPVVPDPKAVAIGLALTVAGFFANFAVAELFFNLDFIFGSVASLLIAYLFGPLWGVLGAAIISIPTFFIWNHPFAIVIFTAEVAFVGYLIRDGRQNILLLDALFWLLFGAALVFVFYAGVMELDFESTLLVAFKQALNGVLNALFAGIIISTFHPARGFLDFARVPEGYSFRDIVIYLVVGFVLVPAIFALGLQTRATRTNLESEVQDRLLATGLAAEEAIDRWIRNVSHGMHVIADSWEEYGEDLDAFDAQMRRIVGALTWEVHSLQVYGADFELLYSYPDDDIPDSVIDAGLQAAVGTDAGTLPGVSRVFAYEELGGDFVSVANTWVGGDGEESQGSVSGLVGLRDLSELLGSLVAGWNLQAVVIDGSGSIISSTDPSFQAGSIFQPIRERPSGALSSGLRVLVPELPPNTPAIERWQESIYLYDHPVAGFPEWTLLLYAPLAPHQDALSAQTLQVLSITSFVVALTILLSTVLSSALIRSLKRLGVLTTGLPRRVLDNETLEWPRSSILEVQQLIENFRGTTELVRRSVQQLRVANSDLVEAKHNADAANRAKSRFLANISHDLRTPLNGVLGYAQLLRRDDSLSTENTQAVAVIERSGRHLLDLLNDILDLSRIEADRVRISVAPLDLRRMLEELIEISRVQASEKGVSLSLAFDDDIPDTVVSDEKKLRQIVMNLLSNAVKFTELGRVRISAEWLSQRVRISVTDTGCGIPEAEREEVFSAFAQGEKPKGDDEGTGLGLAIVKRLVELLGGEIHLESEVGVGTTFWFELPLDTSEIQSEDPKQVIAGDGFADVIGYYGPRQMILSVDDKAENRIMVSGHLSSLGFRVVDASSGIEALEIVERERPDAIILDLVMPHLDGFETFRRLRRDERFADIPVIAASASVAESVRGECLDMGFTEFLPKPLEFESLLRALDESLDLEWMRAGDDARRKSAGAGEEDRTGAGGHGPAAGSEFPSGSQFPSGALSEMRSLTRRGDIKNLIGKAERLAEECPECYESCARVIELARGFRMNELKAFLSEGNDVE